MNRMKLEVAPFGAILAGALAFVVSSTPSGAVSYPVSFNYLTSSVTVASTLEDADSLLLDTLVTTEVGALLQEITFTIGSSVSGVEGVAAWQVNAEAGAGPRLVDVNIDIYDSNDVLVLSDDFEGVLGGFAHSSLEGALDPGTYRLVATGNAVRDAVLDVSLTFAPEPGTLLLTGAGLAGLAWSSRRRYGSSVA
jgi:hypothetical protein